MAIIFILEFLLFAFLGWVADLMVWIVDMAINGWDIKKFTPGGYFRAPFCPIYGVGGLILIFIFEYFSTLPYFLLIIFGTLAMILLEYFGGIFSEKALMVRLWDYSKSKFNVGGYIDARHSFYWLVLVAFSYFYIFPLVLKLESFLVTPKYLDLPVLIVFFFILSWFTIRKSPTRFLEFKDNVLNLSVADYQHLVTDIKKYYEEKSEDVRRVLDERIKKRLKKTDAKLKKRD